VKPVTYGPGISALFLEKLESLIAGLRAQTGNPRWHLHMQSFQVPEYSVRVYAPDGHSQLFNVTMTKRTAEEIRDILLKESELWNSRSTEGSKPIRPGAKLLD
jgi:aspartate-semialdehyde dehydrogenase